MELTRRQFIDLIEIGIEAEDRLTGSQKKALRLVGITANHVRRGTYGTKECGCPLTTAGLFDLNDDFGWPEGTSLSKFANAFDNASGQIKRESYLDDHIWVIN